MYFSLEITNVNFCRWHTSIGETGSSSDDGSSNHGTDSEFFPFGESGAFGKHLNTLSNK